MSLGYTVVLCDIGIASAAMSEKRVAMHLHAAILQLPHVLVFDNSDLHRAYRLVATFERGQCLTRVEPLPPWLDMN